VAGPVVCVVCTRSTPSCSRLPRTSERRSTSSSNTATSFVTELKQRAAGHPSEPEIVHQGLGRDDSARGLLSAEDAEELRRQ
jgi:hypothetical protein